MTDDDQKSEHKLRTKNVSQYQKLNCKSKWRKSDSEKRDAEKMDEKYTKSIRSVFQIETRPLFWTIVQINQRTNGASKRNKNGTIKKRF